MTVTIEDIRANQVRKHAEPNTRHPLSGHPRQTRFVIQGSSPAETPVHVFYELAESGRQSANLPATADAEGRWQVEVTGEFAPGTEVRAFARSDSTPLASTSVIL